MSVLGHDIPILLQALPMLLAAFGGSLHCAVMCGPIRMLTLQTASSRISYQLGRGLSYATLGALVGGMGWYVPSWLLIGGLVIGLAALFFQTRLPAFFGRFRGKILVHASANPFLLGLASALLPCGMLHGWVLVAAAAASPLAGAMVLTALWIGTLPAIELGSWIISRPLLVARRNFPRATPIVILILAIAPILWRGQVAWTKPTSGEPAGCHAHSHVPDLKTKGISPAVVAK